MRSRQHHLHLMESRLPMRIHLPRSHQPTRSHQHRLHPMERRLPPLNHPRSRLPHRHLSRYRRRLTSHQPSRFRLHSQGRPRSQRHHQPLFRQRSSRPLLDSNLRPLARCTCR